MKKLMKNVGIVLLAVLMCVVSVQEPTYADSASVTIAVSNSNLKIGDTISVTVTISTDVPIGSYFLTVTYDPAVLEYTGGSGNGSGGTVSISDSATSSNQNRLSATLNFRAVGNGSTVISTANGEVYDFGDAAGNEKLLPISHAGATVTVSAPQAPSGGGGNGGNNGNNGGNGEAPLTGSDDNYLKSLEISPGTLNPAFQSGTTSYTVELPEDTTSIVVSAVPRDSKAKVAVSHNNDLEPGANKTYIVVTAENGTQRTYVLNINCGEVEDEKDLPPVTIDGAEYTFATAEQMEGVTVPEGFQTAEETYNEQTITVYNSPNQLIQIVYLLDAEGNGQWFIYNKENSSFVPYIEFQANVNRYLILTADASVAIPAGYEAIEIEIQGQKVTGYIKDGNDEFVLVYAMNIQGETGFYLYDTKEGTYQRYVEPEMIEEPASTEEPSTESVIVTEDEKVQNLQVILYVLSGVSVILLGGIIGIVIYFKKKA